MSAFHWLTSVASQGIHLAAQQTSRAGAARFQAALRDTEQVQRQRLAEILRRVAGTPSGQALGIHADMTWEAFAKHVAVSDYGDWQARIGQQRERREPVLTRSPLRRYQPTSGSTSSIKWIPYTDAFLEELDQAISPWLADLYARFPGIRQGRHYWSFSWVPTAMRTAMAQDLNDDLALVPWWKRIFMKLSKAVPDAVALAQTSEDSQFATLCYLLAARDLSFLSVWSPTFLLSLLDALGAHRSALAAALRDGDWGARTAGMGDLTCPKETAVAALLEAWDGRLDPDFLRSLWPALALISAWDTASSILWADRLRELFPGVAFQGKGLWATEGVVTLPFQGRYPLAIRSHFYEFEDLADGRIYPAWALSPGQDVRPLLTTGSGLLRYAMKDRLRVVEPLHTCPCFEFLGRMDGIDLVGEKLSSELAITLLNRLPQTLPDQRFLPLSLLALPVTPTLPCYLVLCEIPEALDGPTRTRLQHEVQVQVEQALQTHFHYRLARDLGQLGPVVALCSVDARALYLTRSVQRGMIAGNVKIEPLLLWDQPWPAAFHDRFGGMQTVCTEVDDVCDA